MSNTDKMTLKAGTVLFHGTDCDDFDESVDSLDGPAWLSTSRSVAEHFVNNRSGWGGRKRIVSYTLDADLQLPEISSAREMAAFAEEHALDLSGVEGIRESVQAAGLAGWVIPNNYPDGDDILIVETNLLTYRESDFLQATPSALNRPF